MEQLLSETTPGIGTLLLIATACYLLTIFIMIRVDQLKRILSRGHAKPWYFYLLVGLSLLGFLPLEDAAMMRLLCVVVTLVSSIMYMYLAMRRGDFDTIPPRVMTSRMMLYFILIPTGMMLANEVGGYLTGEYHLGRNFIVGGIAVLLLLSNYIIEIMETLETPFFATIISPKKAVERKNKEYRPKGKVS